MGSVDKEELGMGDCGVGSIVWVRRRNGSWWPGKIVGPAELTSGHHVSTKSGTPVKLLGREDASVDWYNLGKSKRVKPFRCGEFDKCIEGVKSAVGMPLKKREKYARREDAIIHALELEKQLLNDKSGNLGSKTHVVSTEDDDSDDPICPQEVDGLSQIEEGMETSELLPRMSGLQGLGLKRYQTKRKLSSSTSLNGSHKLEPDGLIDEHTAILGTRSSLVKKKKARNDVLLNESLVKGVDRRRVQVLQNSENLTPKSSLRLSEEEHVQPTSKPNDSSIDDKVTSPVQMAKSTSNTKVGNFSCPTPLNEESASESTESTETDSSKTLSMDSDEDDDEMVGRAESAFVPELKSKSLEPSGQLQHASTNSSLPNDSDMCHHHAPASLGVSKWQIKGKRNKRSFTKRSTGAIERWVADLEEVKSDGFDRSDILERNFSTRKHPYYNQRYTPTSKASFKEDDDVSHSLIDWEHLTWSKQQPLMSGYREDPSNHIGPTLGSHLFGGRMKPGLVHVDLKVQSRYQRERVPMISLMSKFNGKAIVGHPIQVETLENGSTDSLLTGGSYFGHKSSVGKNGLPRKKLPKKNPKKNTSLFSNQKIRNLSAIGKGQRFSNDSSGGNKDSFGGGLMKAEAGSTTVACIPLKLIFCRLNEGLAAVNKI